jgi:hypothetical protein
MKKRIFTVLLTLALTIAMVVPMAMPVSAVNPNLIVNGDFELGNQDFFTEYTYLDPSIQGVWTLGPEYMYTVSTDPSLYHSQWPSFGDHTSGSGKMMIVNGTYGMPVKTVWEQTVNGLECTPTYPESSYPLYAGQDWEIGEVVVKTYADGVCVKFVLTDAAAIADGWLITEAHVAVGATPADIPQTQPNKKGEGGGNPIPGQFPINVEIDPGVTETEWYCLDYDWTAETPFVIAAHAVVDKIQAGYTVTDCLVSGAGTDSVLLIQEGDSGYPAGYPGPYVGTPTPSVLAWEHSAWTDVTGAEWIGSDYYTENTAFNTWRLFTRSFTIPANAFNISGHLQMNCDNAEEATFNNVFIGGDANAPLYGPAPASPTPILHGYGTLEDFDLTNIVAGTNTLSVMTRNYGWAGGSTGNPTGYAYKLCYSYDVPPVVVDSETAWGGGCDEFPGANWATYICYTPDVDCDYGSYTLEFWAANSFPGNPTWPAQPAILEVKINDVVVGTLALDYTPPTAPTPGWKKFSYTWNAGSATSAIITIYDTRAIAYGDDFCIDDISFVKQ